MASFSPQERAAALIAGLPRLSEAGRLRILDPGAGSGSLAAALVARVLRECPVLELEIVAVEIDPEVGRYLQATLTDLTETADAAGAKVAAEIVLGDYIEFSTSLMAKSAALDSSFDLVIMNPPYRKLGLNSSHRRALLRQGVECPNLYAAFLALGAAALVPGGSLLRSPHVRSQMDLTSDNFAVFCSIACRVTDYISSNLVQRFSPIRACSKRT